MAAAARTLGCTRAQVSKQVAELERRLGAALFERSTPAARPHPRREVFLRHAARWRPWTAARSRCATSASARHAAGERDARLRASLRRAPAARRHGGEPRAGDRAGAHRPPGRPGGRPHRPRRAHDRAAAGGCGRAPPAAPALGALRGERLCRAPRHPREPAELAQHACIGHPAIGAAPWGLVAAAGAQGPRCGASRVRFDSLDCTLDAVLAGHGIAILPACLCGAGAAGRQLAPC